MNIIGIDNGVTGSIVILYADGSSEFYPTPTYIEQNYTNRKDLIRRVDTIILDKIISGITDKSVCYIERPMVNPTRFKASCSALRALEATLIVLERHLIPIHYIDSKKWQKAFLPAESKDDTKKESMLIGMRYFPEHKEIIQKRKEADAFLIAMYGKKQEVVNG